MTRAGTPQADSYDTVHQADHPDMKICPEAKGIDAGSSLKAPIWAPADLATTDSADGDDESEEEEHWEKEEEEGKRHTEQRGRGGRLGGRGFYKQVQHAGQVMPVEERPRKKPEV